MLGSSLIKFWADGRQLDWTRRCRAEELRTCRLGQSAINLVVFSWAMVVYRRIKVVMLHTPASRLSVPTGVV